MLKNTNNINYIHSTSILGSKVSGAHIQVEMDLISQNSTCDLCLVLTNQSVQSTCGLCQVHSMLADVAHPCEDMLVQVAPVHTAEPAKVQQTETDNNSPQCHFEGEERDCSEIFIPVITDDGESR